MLGLVLSAALPADAAPERVVSMNLCTDQLAMLMAAPGQLISVSFLARDPMSSSMVEEAQAYPVNRGRAEEIFLLKPDLVLNGSFTSRPAADMLRRLGVNVVDLPPAQTMEDVRTNILKVGDLLGRPEQAAALVARVDAGLAAAQTADENRPRAAVYAPSGYTSGVGWLSDSILRAAGFDNAVAETAWSAGGYLPLELLITLEPDLVIPSERYAATSRAEAQMDHPAIGHVSARMHGVSTSADWVCETPYLLRAIEGLAEIREGLEAAQ